ncbi:hypothetical protein ISP15_04660 [Dyella jejuensis]|uniref:Uncharacterized protein n=1 Tax=Dyella jejuensis TaxID=1432009 RepID=A0ABW8JGK1_9GAMM
MSNQSVDTEINPTTGMPASPAGMHRPHHDAVDTADIAAHDEVLHDAALRESMVRMPR